MKICITNFVMASLLTGAVEAKRKLRNVETNGITTMIVGGDQSEVGEFPYYGKGNTVQQSLAGTCI